METHVTEQQLIDWLFDLAEPEAAEWIAAHVATCPTCQQAKEVLQQKFATLDLLQGDPEVSEDLIQQVTAQATVPRQRLLWPWWLGVAATIVTGLLITQLQHRNLDQPKFLDEVAVIEMTPEQPATRGPITLKEKQEETEQAIPVDALKDPFAKGPLPRPVPLSW